MLHRRRNAVASLNTHDMPPFRSFYGGSDIDDRIDLGFLSAKWRLPNGVNGHCSGGL